MNQQEKDKRKLIKENESQQNRNSQSSQNDDQNQEQNSMNDFLVDDDQEDEVSEDYLYTKKRDDESEDSQDKKKSKKQKKRLKRKLKKQRMKQDESQLDEGDLDVLQQEQIQGGHLNRLKKKGQPKKISYSDEDGQEQQIIQYGQKDGQSLSQSGGGYRQQSSDQSGLQEVIGDDGGDIFQPQDEKRFFQQQEDKQIIAMDIPQRYYYQLRNYAKAHDISIEEALKVFENEDRNAEIKWIYAKFKFINGEQRQVKQKIKNVLEALHKEKVEIMFIYYYRRKIYADALTREDLWQIYKLDQEWLAFKEQFTKLRDNLMNVIFSFQEMPRLENMIQQTVDIQKLRYFRQFQGFKLPQASVGNRKIARNEIITQVRERGIEEWLKKSEAFLNPENLCHNLTNRSHDKKAKNPLYEPRQQLQKVLRSSNPQNDKVRYPLLVPQKRIQTICHYLQLELFTHPQLRKILKEEYYRHLIISTEPTSKGQQDINLYSQYFPVKKIKDKPLRTINREVWILAHQAEKKQLITIELRFQWEQSAIQQRNFEGDIVFKKIIQYYYEVSVHKQGEVWNLFRRQVITRMLSDHFFPAFFKEIKEQLTREGEQMIIKSCCEVFRRKLLMPQRNIRILAMMLEDKKLGIVYVDQFGQQHSPLQITLSNDIELKKFAKDQIIKKYIQDFKPELICIGANSRRAQTLRKAIREQTDQPFSSLCPYEIPSLVAKQRRLEGSTQETTVLEAVSMARFERNPLVETLTLWSDNVQQNGILSMNLHPYQSFINAKKIKDALELVAIEVVNLVGVDINELKYRQNDASRKVLQFVCGFGPRKAFDFFEKIRNQTIFNRNEIEGLVSGKLVFKNCSPFFKVETPYHRSLLDKSDKQKKKEKHSNINLLDTTRIPTDWYKLTQNLVLKAMKVLSVDMRQRKIYTSYNQQTIAEVQMFKDPSKVNSIEWIWKRQEDPFYDQKLVKEQFNSRFKMPVQPKYEFTPEQLFYSLLRQTKHTLKKYMIVTVKIISVVRQKYLNVVIPQNGLFGSIKIHENRPQYQTGNFIKAIIKSFPFEESNDMRPRNEDQEQQLLKVEMVLSFPHPKNQDKSHDHNCFDNCFRTIVKQIHPLIDLQKDRFDLRKQDRPVLQVRQDSSRPMKTQFRKISHKKFKNLAVGPAMELIKNSPIGQFVIRPSSDGTEFLNITWHFFSGVIAHIKVRSQQKSISTSAPVYKIISDKDSKIYESLDKIIDEYITPMNSLVEDIISNRKFMAQPIEKIQEKVKIQMNKDPNLIHYFFGCSPQYPQYFLLVYVYRQKKPLKQLIKVRNTGLYFHDQVFGNIRQLIAWFKGHFKQRDYQSFVKKHSLKK